MHLDGILETIKALNTTAAHFSAFVTHIGDIVAKV